MFKNILVALDGSQHGQAAIEQAIHLAHQFGAQLHGVHVLDSSLLRGPFLHDFSSTLGLEPQMHLTGQIEAFLKARAENLLEAFKERCSNEGLECRISGKSGSIAEVLVEHADLQDLVVMGKRGASYDISPDRESARGIAHQLMKLSPAPLLLTGTQPRYLEKVIVAYDGSPGAHRALKEATRLALCLKLSLLLVFVREPGAPETETPIYEALYYLKPYGIEVRTVSMSGDRIRTLKELSIKEDVDVLFVGYQGTSRLRELFVGHAPDVLMERVPCPIWVSK